MLFYIKTLLVFTAACVISFDTIAQPNAVPKPRHSFVVIAHRGAHVSYPENTLEAYQQAINIGADYVEIDLRTTKDSVLVSMHDGSVNRMTSGQGQIKDMVLTDLKQLMIKSNGSQVKGVYRIPTFEEILKLCKNRIYIYIDFKDASVAQTMKVLKQYEMENQVIVYINSLAQLQEWKRIAPNMPLMLSLPKSAVNAAGFKAFVQQYVPSLLDGEWMDYNEEILNAASQQGIPVWPDIQSKDEDQQWPKAISKGFKGLQTDQPEALIKFLQAKGLR
ncbi:hypothetical protein CKK33_16485 [Mucilaginibacter sp. MD40]|uniref:glycerophosphodiester phosphodiesterase family protein n=1 Tax=Mucilaginibacter sp. MD40 TaxID=2029590 RepID=UPI000BAC8067|nr:glycerophosphodiester phosphodiesterase family protein [Mucilaginibacter sp. MD40]PAW95007.1 hypothetical protein CKK33_16485 [Mucilaginibacter sp. MD40]